MKEMIIFNESSTLTDYIDDQLYSLESYDSEFEDACEVYQELFDAYMNEADFYEEGVLSDIWDTASGADKEENVVLKILFFLPRLLFAIGKTMYEKASGKNVEAAAKATEAIVEGNVKVSTERGSAKHTGGKHHNLIKDSDKISGDITDNIGAEKPRHWATVGLSRGNLTGNNSRLTIDRAPLTAEERGIGEPGKDVPAIQLVDRINVDQNFIRFLKVRMKELEAINNGKLHEQMFRTLKTLDRCDSGTFKSIMQNLDEGQFNQEVQYYNDYLFDINIKAPTGSFITESGHAMPATELGRFLLKVRDTYVQGAKNFQKESKGIEKKIREFYNKNNRSNEERRKAHASNVKWFFKKVITPYFSKMSVCIDKTGTAIGNALIEYAKYFEKISNTKIIPSGVTPDSVANTIPNRRRTAGINDLGRNEGTIYLGTSKKSNTSNTPNKSTTPNKPNKSTNKPNKSNKSKSIIKSVAQFFQNSYYDEFDDNDETFVESYLI